jgi:transposase
VTRTTRELPDDVEALKALIAEKEALLAEREAVIARLEHQVHVLSCIAFEPRSERRPSRDFDGHPSQTYLLFPELLEAAERTADATGQPGTVEIRSQGSERAPKKGRRTKFPGHLPVFRTTYELPEAERACRCGKELTEIGEEVSRELERLELTAVHEIARKKYACRSCEETVRTAPGPDRVIDKGLLGVGFLAQLIVERFGNHQPYHRLEKKYGSEGLALDRSVLCKSTRRCAEILEPIYEQMRRDVVAAPVIHTDDTPVTVASSTAGGRKQGRVWIYLGPKGEHVYDYTESRSRDGPIAVLGDYRGYIQADAFPGYDVFFGPEGAKEVACWAHARRRFIEAEKTERALAAEAVSRIGELYSIERAAKELSDDERRELRQREAAPRLGALHDWLAATRLQVLDKGPMGRAIDYALANWQALCRYTEDGRLAIDNNAAERALRAVAVGRKNWMFVGNEGGGRTAAVLYSLVMTAKAVGVDPRVYLRDVLLRIARESDVATLTPYGWKERWAGVADQHRLSILERLTALAGSEG